MRKLPYFLLLLAAGYAGLTQYRRLHPAASRPQEIGLPTHDALAQAMESKASGVQIEGRGKVLRMLPDDSKGSRHQRFILQLPSGQTLLVAHNIDLAPRIDSLKAGDEVVFRGEYEWDPKGGVIHWTHHDPGGRHVAGWLRHEGRTYQ